MWQPKRHIQRFAQRQPSRLPIRALLSWLIGVVASVLLGYGLYWSFFKVLVVQQITCYVNSQQLADEECQAAEALLGRSLLFTDFEAPAIQVEMQKVATTNHLLYYTHLRKQMPNHLKLYYEVSQPAYLLSTDQTTWFAVNERGALKIISEPGQLPKVFCAGAWGNCVSDGQVADVRVHHWLLAFLAQAKNLGREIGYVGLDDSQLVSVVFQDGRRILVTGMADPTVELARLRLIEQESAQDERFSAVKVVEIDLRFKFPVIRTLPRGI